MLFESVRVDTRVGVVQGAAPRGRRIVLFGLPEVREEGAILPETEEFAVTRREGREIIGILGMIGRAVPSIRIGVDDSFKVLTFVAASHRLVCADEGGQGIPSGLGGDVPARRADPTVRSGNHARRCMGGKIRVVESHHVGPSIEPAIAASASGAVLMLGGVGSAHAVAPTLGVGSHATGATTVVEILRHPGLRADHCCLVNLSITCVGQCAIGNTGGGLHR